MTKDEGIIALIALREEQEKIAFDLIAINLETSVDCFIFSILHRSISLLKGFELLIRNNNFETAGLLVRAQLDSIIRINAPRYAENDIEFFVKFNSGIEIGEMKSNDKKANGRPQLLKDFYLKEKFIAVQISRTEVAFA
jgi:hypothetical protein